MLCGRRAVVIANPAAGNGSARALGARLDRAGLHAPIWLASHPDELACLTRRALLEGFDLIVAAGGDGTLGTVADAMMRARARTSGARSDGIAGKSGDAGEGENAVLGVLPCGTGNDFARALGIGTGLEGALEALERGSVRTIDVGHARFSDCERFWLNVAGAGFDSLVAARLNRLRRHRFWRYARGTSAYLLAVAAELLRLRAREVRLELDGGMVRERMLLCAVANARSYGGGMLVAPRAKLDDGRFDVCSIERASRLEFALAFPGVFAGRHEAHPKVAMRRARVVHLAARPPLPVLLDGEIAGSTPVRLQVVPGALQVVAPPRGPGAA